MVGRIRLPWFIAFMLSAFASPVFSGGCLELVGRWPYGPAIAVAVSGEHAYLVSGSSLLVADVVDPSSPKVTGRVTLPDVAYLVDVAEGFAYVVTESNEIQIIDIRLPSDPVIVGSLQLPDQARRVAVADGYLYVALGDIGLFLVDVSTPSMPRFIETIDGEAFDVVVSGRYAYVGSAYSLRILDVAVPTSAVEIGSAPGNFEWGSIAVSGDLVYGTLNRGLGVYDASDPTNPALLGQSDEFAGGQWDMAVVGSSVAVLGADPLHWFTGVFVLDVQDPEAPVLTGSSDLYGLGVTVLDDYFAIAAAADGLVIMDLSTPGTPAEIGVVKTPGSAAAVDGTQDFTFIAEFDGLRILDTSNPARPAEVGFFECPRGAWDVAVVGDLAFIVGDSGWLRVIDVSEPASPEEIGSFHADTPPATDVEVVGNYAYVVASYLGFIVDVSDPTSPVLAGWLFEERDRVDDIEISGNHAFVVSHWERYLKVFDVTDPADPALVSEIETQGEPVDIEVVGSLAYVAYPSFGGFGSFQGLQILDVSDPALPVEVAALGFYEDSWSSAELAVHGNCALIGASESLYAFDVTVPTNPVLVRRHEAVDSVRDVAVFGDLLITAESSGGLEQFDISGCSGLARAPREIGGRRVP